MREANKLGVLLISGNNELILGIIYAEYKPKYSVMHNHLKRVSCSQVFSYKSNRTAPIYIPLVGDVNLVITGRRTLTSAINSANAIQGLKSQDFILIAVMIILIQLTS